MQCPDGRAGARATARAGMEAGQRVRKMSMVRVVPGVTHTAPRDTAYAIWGKARLYPEARRVTSAAIRMYTRAPQKARGRQMPVPSSHCLLS